LHFFEIVIVKLAVYQMIKVTDLHRFSAGLFLQ